MEDRGHELCILLIGGIIGQLSKPLVIQRFPDETIEQSALLRDPGTQRIKIILRTDHLRAGRIGIRVQIHPVGSITQCMGSRSDGHRNTIMTESHPYITHDDSLSGIEQRLPCSRFV